LRAIIGDARHIRQPEIDQHNVGGEVRDRGDRGLAFAEFGDDGVIGVGLQGRDQQLAQHRIVFNDRNANGLLETGVGHASTSRAFGQRI
jgi:hypothetical protein